MVRDGGQLSRNAGARGAGDARCSASWPRRSCKVGDAQGHPTSANLGDTAGARASYRRAIAIARPCSPATMSRRARTLARAHRQLADVLAWSGDMTGGAGRTRSARGGCTRRSPPRAGRRSRTGCRRRSARSSWAICSAIPTSRTSERPAEALQPLRRGTVGAARAGDAQAPQHERVRRYVGLDAGAASARWTKARADWDGRRAGISGVVRDPLGAGGRGQAHNDIQRDLAVAYEKLGNVQRARGRHAAAIDSYRGALAQFERLAEADPSNAVAARSAAISREKLADTLVATDVRAEATPCCMRRSPPIAVSATAIPTTCRRAAIGTAWRSGWATSLRRRHRVAGKRVACGANRLMWPRAARARRFGLPPGKRYLPPRAGARRVWLVIAASARLKPGPTGSGFSTLGSRLSDGGPASHAGARLKPGPTGIGAFLRLSALGSRNGGAGLSS